MFNTETNKERVLLIAVENERDTLSAESGLDELALLAETSGAEVVGRLIQRRESVHPGHYVGKGKLDELQALIQQTHADAVISDDELTASQQKNMGQRLNVRILDRTMVILDIFAARALSAEGKAQVELAQLKYRLSHLSGLGAQLSRQAGGGGIHGAGIGTRGPGEKKLETDRRHIHRRVTQLNQELRDILEERKILREKRVKTGIPVISLVGYTNAGKSTLMNALTEAGVLVENQLFATLDTTTRRAALPGGTEVLFTDTVGFIHKLPHHLVQAFRATLEELQYADILLHVVDSSNPARDNQSRVVKETLRALQCGDKPVVTACNKADLCPDGIAPDRMSGGSHVPISALTGENIPSLLKTLETVLQSMRTKMRVLIPYHEGHLVNWVHDRCEILSESHEAEGTLIEAYANPEMAGRLRVFSTNIAE